MKRYMERVPSVQAVQFQNTPEGLNELKEFGVNPITIRITDTGAILIVKSMFGMKFEAKEGDYVGRTEEAPDIFIVNPREQFESKYREYDPTVENTAESATSGSDESMPANRLIDNFGRRKLNDIYAIGEVDANGASGNYSIWRGDHSISCAGIVFQVGAPWDETAQQGVEEIDLLLIVRDRLISMQDGPRGSEANVQAIISVEAAIRKLIEEETAK